MNDNGKIIPFEELSEKVVKYACDNNINKIAIFAKGTENVLKLNDKCKKTGIELFAVTFPTNQAIYVKNEDDDIEEVYPEILYEENKELLVKNNIKLVSSTMPLEPIVIPGERSNPYGVISQSLNLFGEGVDLCVQISMMLTDQGYTQPNEQILSMNGRLALDLQACNSRFLFHPSLGLEINRIIK